MFFFYLFFLLGWWRGGALEPVIYFYKESKSNFILSKNPNRKLTKNWVGVGMGVGGGGAGVNECFLLEVKVTQGQMMKLS